MNDSDDAEPELIKPASIVLLAVLFEGGLALLALAIGWLTQYDPVATLRWTWDGLGWGVAATLPPLGMMLWCTHSSLAPCRRMTELVRRTLLPYFASCTWLDLAMIALAAGIGEELLFRGLAQTMLDAWFGPVVALVAASILFGLAHSITPTYAIFAAVMGAWLGAVWMWSDNLLAPLVTHALYDFVTLAYLRGRKLENRSAKYD